MLFLIIYFTGLIVSLIYDLTLLFSGVNPWGNRGLLFTIFDISLWPFSLISALILSVFAYKKGIRVLKSL